MSEMCSQRIGRIVRLCAAYRRYILLATGTLANFFSGIVCPQAVASPMPASWNQITVWLKQIDALREAA
jgi:hypothetical protein